MPKRAKRISPSVTIDLSQFERRPVKESDKWCVHDGFKTGHVRPGSAPWGYIVTIPYLPNKDSMLSGIDGCIVRTKKHCGNLLLQILPSENSPAVYGVQSFGRNEPRLGKAKKRQRKQLFRVFHPRNLAKNGLRW